MEVPGFKKSFKPLKFDTEDEGKPDVDPTSPTYSKVVRRLLVIHFGGELHHSGWNACSSCNGNQSFTRLWSQKISCPRLGWHILTFAHCIASSDILFPCLGDKHGNAEGNGFLIPDSDLK
jgi:selenium-binding protein 1